MYSLGVSEEITGRALRSMAKLDELVIATKVFFPMNDRPNMGGLSRKHIVQACEASLRRLGIDTIDLYQIHRFDRVDADRRDARRARPSRASGQGSLHRRELRLRVAAHARAEHLRAQRLGAVRLDAEPLQPPLPRRRARDDSALPRSGARRSFPGRRSRAASSRGRARRPRARRCGRRTIRSRIVSTARPIGRSSTRSSASRASAASRWRRSGSRGCYRSAT